MAVELNLKALKTEEKDHITIEFTKKGNQVSLEEANKEGFSIDADTFRELLRLVQMGKRYEIIERSHKSEFQDL